MKKVVIATIFCHECHMTKNPIRLEKFWPYQAVVLADLVSRQTAAILKEHSDLNLSQWRVLAAVAEKPGRASAEVVSVTPMDKGIVSRAAASLVTQGILKKIGDNSDKRRSRLYLTATGEQLYAKISKALKTRAKDIGAAPGFNTQLKEIIAAMKAGGS